MKHALYGLMILMLCWVSIAAPTPAVVQGPLHWTLEANLEPLTQLLYPETNQPNRFWYTILTITNTAGRDVQFVPRCDLMTDTFQVIPAGKTVPIGAFYDLQERHQLAYPLLEYIELADSPVLEGRDNARDIAIIWPDFDPRARQVKIFIGGLSNETVALDHPAAKDADGIPAKVYLRKTLELTYEVSARQTFATTPRVTFKGQRWVMR